MLVTEMPVGVGDSVPVPVLEGESVGVAVRVTLRSTVCVAVGVWDVDAVRDSVGVGVSEAVGAVVGVLDFVPEGGSSAGLSVGVAEAVGTTARGTPGAESPAAARLPSRHAQSTVRLRMPASLVTKPQDVQLVFCHARQVRGFAGGWLQSSPPKPGGHTQQPPTHAPPLRHLTEAQGLHESHGRRSTSAGHGRPAPVAGCSTGRVRCCAPAPHVAMGHDCGSPTLQPVHAPHTPTLQSQSCSVVLMRRRNMGTGVSRPDVSSEPGIVKVSSSSSVGA